MFRSSGGTWQVRLIELNDQGSYETSDWMTLGVSSIPTGDLVLQDFDGDGMADILAPTKDVVLF